MPDEIQGQARHLLYRMLDKDPVTRIKVRFLPSFLPPPSAFSVSFELELGS